MAKWIKIKNNKRVDINKIPIIEIDDMRSEVKALGMRPIGFFGKDWGFGCVRLFVILADDANADLYLSSSIFGNGVTSYESFTQEVPAFHIFEREFYEQFGIEPLHHPWLKPVRVNQDKYQFFEMEGEEVHQVAVGPIHAGVIEPGHFRFMCNGETVYHLEIMLGYQHRGVEDMMLKNPSNQLAESICGDSVIAYNTAYSQIMETLKGIQISDKAQLIRKMALEMERIAVHIGDLGAISGDIAYLMGASVFGATRTLVINTTLEMCGSRLGRGFVTVGGVNYDPSEEVIDRAVETLNKVRADVDRMVKTMLKNSTVMSRLEKTGTVSLEKAKDIGLVGMAARTCGVDLDSRFDFPDKWVEEFGFTRKTMNLKGDVNARFKLRYKEIKESISMVKKILAKLKDYKDEPIIADGVNNKFLPDSMVVSIVEGWRGEVVHIAMTDLHSKLSKYKIKDPSFNNWYGLGLAVRNNGISDFPLCNKSFNLSYCGNDL
ncbi:hydrogenase [bacterium]|nr:hydrogenase [bacterium]